MVLENKLGITASPDLQNAEERLSKMRAVELFTGNLLDEHTPGFSKPLRSSIIISSKIYMISQASCVEMTFPKGASALLLSSIFLKL